MTQTREILIAEDDPILREAYRRVFASRTPFAIRTAENGEIAVEMIRQKAPDLLICDFMMPKRDGRWVLEQFPRDSREFPVIMLTNMEDPETRKICADLGMDGYLIKKDMTLHSLIEMSEKLLKHPSA